MDFHLNFVLLFTRHRIENFLENLSVIGSRVLALQSLLFERLYDLTDVREQREVNAEVVALDLSRSYLLVIISGGVDSLVLFLFVTVFSALVILSLLASLKLVHDELQILG